jgi:hypothetical protein
LRAVLIPEDRCRICSGSPSPFSAKDR